jgi:hypothetical protein
MYSENDLKSAIQNNVQSGLMKVNAIIEGEPSYALTNEGFETIEKMVSNKFNLDYEEYKNSPQSIKIWFTKELIKNLSA